MKISTIALFLCAAISTANAQTSRTSWKFDFGAGKASNGFTGVSDKNIYSKETGYGFEPGASVACTDKGGKTSAGFCTSDKPFYFSAAVPEGNYKVTVTFGDKTDATTTTVKAELRRLMREKVSTNKGKFDTESFIVNVRTPQFPGGEVKLKDREKTTEIWAWDDKLTLEFNNSKPTIDLITIAKADVPTIFLLGDSTVTDQSGEPYASWGQMLTAFFKPEVAVANNAESGESLRSSLGAKRLDKVLSQLNKGDYVLIQYGHNDEKEKGEGVGALTTYKASLKKYVEAIRAKGGNAVLITPMHRRTFDENGKITNSHGDYLEAVHEAAKEENVPLIDLAAMSKQFYEALGKEKSGVAFKEGDATHHSKYGAYELAKMIVEGIKADNLPIAKYLITMPKFDSSKPDSFETFVVPASPTANAVKPLGS
ncbi:MAG: rhamnogalacturonan acetylesterase [Acidobacteriota bacterium]|nr:rhamnogalacturonan acetylesterase [Acidobacteriota bacterium]